MCASQRWCKDGRIGVKEAEGCRAPRLRGITGRAGLVPCVADCSGPAHPLGHAEVPASLSGLQSLGELTADIHGTRRVDLTSVRMSSISPHFCHLRPNAYTSASDRQGGIWRQQTRVGRDPAIVLRAGRVSAVTRGPGPWKIVPLRIQGFS